MSDPVVRLEDVRLTVQPGGQARTRVTVANPGQIVEGFRLDVVGEAAPWAEVTPPEVQVYPQQEASAVVVFSPPTGSGAASGTLPFGVRARSVVDAERSAVEEGDLDIGAVPGLQAKLTPVTSTGRLSAAHAVELTNWGNRSERLRLRATDPDEQLAFLVHPGVVELPVGGTAVASVQVRTRSPFLRGSPVRRPFQVVAEPHEAAPGPPPPPGTDPGRAALDGAMQQMPFLSRGTVLAGTLAVVLVGALGALALRSEPTAFADLRADADVATPGDVRVEPVDATTLRVLWAPPERAPDAYRLLRVDPATSRDLLPRVEADTEVPGDQTVQPVGDLEPETDYCFAVAAQRLETRSVPSAPVCTRTPAAPADPGTGGSPTPAPPGSSDSSAPSERTGSPDPTPSRTESPSPSSSPASTLPSGGGDASGRWVAIIDATDQEGRAQRIAEALRADGVTAEVLETADQPDLVRALPYVVVVRGDFPDAASVEAFCAENPEVAAEGNQGCRPGQLVAAG